MNIYWKPLLSTVCLSTLSYFLLLFSTDRLYRINVFHSLFLRSFKGKLGIKMFPVECLGLLRFRWPLHVELSWLMLPSCPAPHSVPSLHPRHSVLLTLSPSLPSPHSVPLTPCPPHSVPLTPSPSLRPPHSVPLTPCPPHSVPLPPSSSLRPPHPVSPSLRPPHSVPLTPSSSLRPPHSVLHTPSPSLPPPHSVPLTPPPSLPPPHSVPLTPPPSLPPPHSVPLTPSPSLPPPHSVPLTPSPSLPPPHSVLLTPSPSLCPPHSVLLTPFSILRPPPSLPLTPSPSLRPPPSVLLSLSPSLRVLLTPSPSLRPPHSVPLTPSSILRPPYSVPLPSPHSVLHTPSPSLHPRHSVPLTPSSSLPSHSLLLWLQELVRLLQQTVRSSQYDKYFTSSRFCEGVPQDTLGLLHQKDDQILGLSSQLERFTLDKESLQQEVKTLKSKVGELSEQLGMLMETIQAKDEVIMKLSRQLSECEGSVSSPTSTPSSPVAAPSGRDQLELDKLKDNLQGYKTQNKFLNKEILELSALRRNAERRERDLMAKYSSLEAKLCQIESKYLILLQEVKTPVCSEEQGPARDVIAQLLEDALQVESPEHPEQAFVKPHLVSEYDIYGFRTVPEDDEEEKLVAKVRALDLKTLYLTENQEVSTGVKWENYFASTMNREMMCSPELKNLIRAGIPHEHRSKVWKWCVDLHTRKFKDSTQPGYFQNLLQKALEKQNPASKQIELDLLRTLPNNKHYSCPTSEGIQKLRNVLLAFSWRNPDIGYCQGLNRLVAVALLYLEQEDAFWCLVTIVEVFMPRDYYTKTLLGSQVDQRVFRDLMSEKLPRLHTHFEQYKVDYTLITFNWFLVVFVDSVVSDILFKIWDSFLYEGPKVIFRFALALFKYKEEEILKLQDSMSIFKYLRYFTRTILDARKLISISFGDLNPFPLRQIRNRRAYHLEKVRLELTELEAIREDFLRERDTSPDKGELVSDEEEDT
uniref:TBC1 domain family member 2B n=1 Tax=Sus scrofa TaxID=9823 RepID=A0A8D0SQG4_PIG